MADLPSSRASEAPASPASSSTPSTRQLLDELDDLMQKMLALPVQDNEDESEAVGEVKPPTKELTAPISPAASGSAVPRTASLAPVPPVTVTVHGPHPSSQAKHATARQAPKLRPVPASNEQPSRPNILPEPAEKPVAGRVVGQPPHSPKENLDSAAAPTYLPVGAEPLLPVFLQRPKAIPEPSAAPLLRPATKDSGKPPEPATPMRPLWLKAAPTAAPEPAQGLIWLLPVNRTFDRFTALFGPAGRWLRGEQGRWLVGWSGIAMLVAALIWAALLFFG